MKKVNSERETGNKKKTFHPFTYSTFKLKSVVLKDKL